MREIKFRAWNEVVKSWLPQDYFAVRGDGQLIFLETPKYHLATPHYKVSRFTGLLDREGKEIYEGDIVACPYVDPMGRLHEKDMDKEKSGVIVFEQGLFGIKYPHHVKELKSWCKRSEGQYIGNYGHPKIYEENTYLEIIGNIYENPELASGDGEGGV